MKYNLETLDNAIKLLLPVKCANGPILKPIFRSTNMNIIAQRQFMYPDAVKTDSEKLAISVIREAMVDLHEKDKLDCGDESITFV